MPCRKERFWLRFRGLSDQAQKDIRCALPEAEATQRGAILLLRLQVGMNLEPLYGVLDELQLGPKEFDANASVVTSSDNGGIDLPAFFLELIRRARCAVGFSFVNVGPEDVEDDHAAAPITLQ